MNDQLTYREFRPKGLDPIDDCTDFFLGAIGSILKKGLSLLGFVAEDIAGEAAIELLMWVLAVFVETL